MGVHVGRQIPVGGRQIAAGDGVGEASLRLDGEGVEGEVVRLELEGGLEGGLPFVERLSREAVHEIEAEVGAASSAGGTDGLAGLGGRVHAVEEPEEGVGEGLDPEAEAVDAGGEEGRCLLFIYRPRVGFDGHLDGFAEGEPVAEPLHDARNPFRRQDRGRPAAEVDGLDGSALELVGGGAEVDLDGERVEVAAREGEPAGLLERHGGEVAVGAFAEAEGQMEIERGAGKHRHDQEGCAFADAASEMPGRSTNRVSATPSGKLLMISP